jgi:hypothetical protein
LLGNQYKITRGSRIMKSTLYAAACVVVLVITPTPAFAYLDPGTGSVIIQGILGAIVGGIFVVRLYWRRLLTFLGIRKQDPEEGDEADGPQG